MVYLRALSKVLCLSAAALGLALPLFGQIGVVQGHCYQGGTPATTSGMSSSNFLQGIIPACTVTVYLHGTTTPAQIYTPSGGTLTNPFTANAVPGVDPGGWVFAAATNQALDVVLSGGNGNPNCTTPPLCYVQPVTLIDVFPSGSGSGGLPPNIAFGGTNASGTFQASPYTPVNKAGDTMTGTLNFSNPPLSFTQVTAWGDSLTCGNQDGSGGSLCGSPSTGSWTNIAATLLGKPVSNQGIPGQTSSQIAVRANAYAGTWKQQATVSGNTIPASGGVTITFPTGYEPAMNTNLTNMTVAINLCGVRGTVADNGSHVYTFTRTTSGSAVSCPANSQWTPDLTGLVGPNVVEVIEAGYNNRSGPSISTVTADVAAMVAAARSRSNGYVVVGIPNGDTDTCPLCSQYLINANYNAAQAATYGSAFYDLNTDLVNHGNPSVPADAYLASHHNATPLSLKAWDLQGNLTAPIGTTGCPVTWTVHSLNGGASMIMYGTAMYFPDNGEIIYLNDQYLNNPPQSCIRGFNGTTAAAHSGTAVFYATDGLHLSSSAKSWAPPLNGNPGYTVMANGIVNTINNAVQPISNVVLPSSNGMAISSSDGSKSLGFVSGGLQSNTGLLFAGGCTNCPVGTANNPATGLYVQENSIYNLDLNTWNGGVLASSGYNFHTATFNFSLSNAGTSGYVNTNNAATTTSGSGSGMIVDVFANGTQITGVLILNNGTGYNVGDKVYPIVPGSSGDAYITLIAAPNTNFGMMASAGGFVPSCQGCAGIGASNDPFGALYVNDPTGNGSIQLIAQGAVLQSSAGYWGVTGGLMPYVNTYPQFGNSGGYQWGSLFVKGQSSGRINLTNAGNGSIIDQSGGAWGITGGVGLTGVLNLQGTSSPLWMNSQPGTPGQVLTSQGAGNTPIWANPTGPTKYTPSFTPSAVAASSCAEQTFSLTGLTVGQSVTVNPPSSLAPHLWIGGQRVSAANTLAIEFCGDATSGTPPSGAWIVTAYQ